MKKKRQQRTSHQPQMSFLLRLLQCCKDPATLEGLQRHYLSHIKTREGEGLIFPFTYSPQQAPRHGEYFKEHSVRYQQMWPKIHHCLPEETHGPPPPTGKS